MKLRRAAWIVLALVLASAALSAEPAAACSCVIGDPRTMLAESDGAFVGTFVEKREPPNVVSSADDAVYVFRVERVVKGSIGATVEVVSATDGASCGLEVEPGQRIGLFLSRVRGVWRSVLCLQIEPDRLLEAARPLPAPNSRGPLALLVGGRAGPVRTIGLDARGRTVAYGRGRGQTMLLAMCPGGRRAVEYAFTQPGFLLAVRELRTFRIVRERPYRARGQGRVTALACRTATGSEVAVFETTEAPPAAARILIGSRPVWSGTALDATFTTEAAYVSSGTRLLRIELRTGKSATLATIPRSTVSLSIAPDRRIGGVAPSRLVLFDPAVRPSVRTVPLSGPNVTGSIGWSEARLVFLPHWNADAVRVYDPRLRLVGRFASWNAGASVVAGGRAFGVGRGVLLTAVLPRGPARAVRVLPTPVTEALAAVR